MIKKYRKLQEEYRNKSDEYNPIYLFQGVATELLAAIATGELDAKELVEIELMNRGRDECGKWIGFDKAVAYWSEKTSK